MGGCGHGSNDCMPHEFKGAVFLGICPGETQIEHFDMTSTRMQCSHKLSYQYLQLWPVWCVFQDMTGGLAEVELFNMNPTHPFILAYAKLVEKGIISLRQKSSLVT